MITLSPRTAKGKNKLREVAAAMPEWDGTWVEGMRLSEVQFAPGKAGPWLYLKPNVLDSWCLDRFGRWVHESLDHDFGVLKSALSPAPPLTKEKR